MDISRPTEIVRNSRAVLLHSSTFARLLLQSSQVSEADSFCAQVQDITV